MTFFDAAGGAPPFELDDTEKGFAEDARIHLGSSENTVDKDYGHLGDAKSQYVCCIFHLNLESVAFEVYRIQVHGSQYFGAVAYKSGGGIAHVQSGDYAHIFGGIIGSVRVPWAN